MQGLSGTIGTVEINALTILVRMLFAILCGGALGFERMYKRRAAGLRTYILVCAGACVTMITGYYVTQVTGTGDPARMAAQVISGIGFIGAGTIIFAGNNRVKGLTTAAGLWATAAMGLAIGAGMYIGSLIILAVLLLSMTIGSFFQDIFLAKAHRLSCYLIIEDAEKFKHFLRLTKKNDFQIIEFESQIVVGECVGLTVTINLPHGMAHKMAMDILQEGSGAVFVREI